MDTMIVNQNPLHLKVRLFAVFLILKLDKTVL